jgi:hypothetical protein
MYDHGHRVGGGYRFIFDNSNTSVAFFQLLANVAVAALLGAIIANLSRRAVWWTARILVIMAIALAAWAGFLAFQEQMRTGAEKEGVIARFKIQNGDFNAAKEHLLKASDYWWWKGWWDGARSARERALDEEGMKKQAAASRAQKDEARVMQLLGMTNPFDQFHLPAFYPNDQKVKEAKQLLLDAAEKWHVAGKIAEEQRVMEWEKNVKTADEFLGPPADQPGSKADYRVIVADGVITVADANSGAVLGKTTLKRWGVVAPNQDKLRHVALDVTAALVAGNGGREHTVDPSAPVYTSADYDKGKARSVTATVERGVAFAILSDTRANDRYEALIFRGTFRPGP